jgi:NADH:ubiquinone oxidoreductase subunit H
VPGPPRLPVLVCQRSLIVSNIRDVEKRWRDPEALRHAVAYGIGVIVVAGVAFAVFAVVDKGSVVLASAVPGILFLGGVGALVQAYRVWRNGGTWPIWQGAGWFLLTLMLVCLSIPWSAAMFASGIS